MIPEPVEGTEARFDKLNEHPASGPWARRRDEGSLRQAQRTPCKRPL